MGFLFTVGVLVLALVLVCHFSPRARTVLVTVVALAVMQGWYKWRQATAEERQGQAEADREAYLRSREHREWQERDRRWQEEKAAALRKEAEAREAAERKAAAKKEKKKQKWKVWRLLGRSPVAPASSTPSSVDHGSTGSYSDAGSTGSASGRHRYDNGGGVGGARGDSPAPVPRGLVGGSDHHPAPAQGQFRATQWGGGASVSSRDQDGTPLPHDGGGGSATPAELRRRHATPFSAAGSHMSTPYESGHGAGASGYGVEPSPFSRSNGYTEQDLNGDGHGAGAGDDGTAGVPMPHFDDNAPGLADYDDNAGAGGLADYDDDAGTYDDGTRGVRLRQ